MVVKKVVLVTVTLMASRLESRLWWLSLMRYSARPEQPHIHAVAGEALALAARRLQHRDFRHAPAPLAVSTPFRRPVTHGGLAQASNMLLTVES